MSVRRPLMRTPDTRAWRDAATLAIGITMCAAALLDGFAARTQGGELSVAVFRADATPPLGSPAAYGPARKIEDPLSARGIVLLGAGKPVVLCAVDWIGIGNSGHDQWRAKLAEAAGTTPDRVAVHTLHQHDAPRCDFAHEEILASIGLGGTRYDVEFARRVIRNTAAAVRQAVRQPSRVTQLGVGRAVVEKVASNRRILGSDGKVVLARMSSCRNPEAVAAPEGVIDPVLRMLSFWDRDRPIVCLSYYATHPVSHYGQGYVTADFVGLARAQRERELSGLPHIHFNGAGGNVAAGKYNDGSPAARVALTERMVEALRKAWEATAKRPVDAQDVEWRVVRVKLPPAEHLNAETLRRTLADPGAERFRAAGQLAFLERVQRGHGFELSCLRVKDAYVLHMPGELFVEYQLAAQQMKPQATVCMAAYGDYGPWYIGTEIAYWQGGYETGRTVSNVAPQVERVLMQGLRELLKD